MRDLPPELAVLSKRELREAYEAATLLALRLTRSESDADDLVGRAFERLLTTRRWRPEGGPLLKHLFGILTSLLSIERHSRRGEREGVMHEAFHREVAGTESASAEDRTLDAAETERRRAQAAQVLALLEAAVASHPVAPLVLECQKQGVTKAAEIALKLGVPVEQVYRANEVLRYHLEKIRKGSTEVQ